MALILSIVLLASTTITTRTYGFSPISTSGHNVRSSTSKKTSTQYNSFQHFMAKDENDLLSAQADTLNAALEKCQPEFIKTCRVKVGVSENGNRLALLATDNMKKGDVALAIPYEDQIVLSPSLALKEVFKDVLPKKYDGWTGDNGILAMMVLNELAKIATDGNAGIPLPKRKPEASYLISAWVEALPSPSEMKEMNMNMNLHPILWGEEDQETLQSSTTKKIYRILDDMDEDSAWLEENIWSKDRIKFPETVTMKKNGGETETYDCFNPDGFAWAFAIATSRSVFLEGSSRIIPIMDMANHADIGVEEVQTGYMGTFGTTKGSQLRTGAGRKYKQGEEVYASYGPKSAAEYLLDHGFVTQQTRSMTTCVAEISFEIDPDDRFYDDKLDVLEFETYDSAPMEPLQSFDIVSEVGRDGEPDPAMIQFLRLLKLDGKDAFLLESIFRKEIWEFMSEPVSEPNERAVLDAIESACSKALKSMEGTDTGVTSDDDNSEEIDPNSPASLCAILRESETRALSRTMEFVNREKEALDLKVYYQERRLQDLGLDSEWNNPDEGGSADAYADDDLGFGQSRAPGSLDW
eukprot:CAMPEP_0194121596 /NCGR_PEP_ID=MMETSP0150-20130528/47635_1 /TAXON_ID=122233 /ORGANISM="Chaetoceros debilis, Strain MM31A-1" /LENGTH=579 /DNA_ID=CAMNT_0038814103 /DNA_START=194 /DNA_END=1933 /DNA_ORIENTATION=+